MDSQTHTIQETDSEGGRTGSKVYDKLIETGYHSYQVCGWKASREASGLKVLLTNVTFMVRPCYESDRRMQRKDLNCSIFPLWATPPYFGFRLIEIG